MPSKVLSDHEVEFLGHAWASAKGGSNFSANVDYDKLAALVGHTNTMSTRNMLRRIEKKLLASTSGGDTDGGDSSVTGTPKTPKGKAKSGNQSSTPSSSPNKRKANDANAYDGDNEDDEEIQSFGVTPTRGRPNKAAAEAAKKPKIDLDNNQVTAKATAQRASVQRSVSSNTEENENLTAINAAGRTKANTSKRASAVEEDGAEGNQYSQIKSEDGKLVI